MLLCKERRSKLILIVIYAALSRGSGTGMSLEADIGGGSTPATNFRDATTDGIGMWGPILGGLVVVGGAIAIGATLLHEENGPPAVVPSS